jgi:transcriptional regulator with XRE-family HTH domain
MTLAAAVERGVLEGSPMRLTSMKLCRFERGVMQNVLARRADIAWGRLSAIENGFAEARLDELQRIAAALQVPLDALLAGYSGAHPGA